MIDKVWDKTELQDFGGPWTALDPMDVPSGRALLAQNVEYLQGQVSSRKGYGQAFNSNEASSALYNWISSLGNNLVWFKAGTGVRRIDIGAAVPSASTIVATASGNGATFASSGPRLYTSIFNTSGAAATSGYVTSYQSAAFVSDKLFPPPMTYTPAAPTEPGAGVITPGSHRLGYIVEYRHGFIGRPSPDTGAGTPGPTTFTPVTKTAAGAKNFSWVLNTTWPADAVKVHVIMTPVSNPSLYVFVPGANSVVAGGTAASYTIVFSISDDDLMSLGNDATNYLFYYTRTVSGTDPFQPSVLVPYGNRMTYVTTTLDSNGNKMGAVFVSNRNNYQQVTLDRHLVQIPGQLDIVTAFVLRGTYYIVGPHWTYATRDTGSDPVEWPAAKLIDGKRGTLAPRGVVGSPTGSYAWVADESGLYLFDGSSYPSLPVSYYNRPEWERINWAAAWCVQVVDDPSRKRVYVLAPLDSATTPSHILIWDYTRGMEPTQVSFSLDTIASYGMGAMTLVRNTLTGTPTAAYSHVELWVSPSGASPILRRMQESDTNPYRDNGAAVTSTYQTGLFPPGSPVRLLNHYGGYYRVYGAGVLTIQAAHLDGSWTTYLSPITLAATPGINYLRQFYRPGEQVSYKFEDSTLDGHFVLSGLQHYFSPYAQQR